MPDTLNKQALINLLIDSPLREPIKINLIDIVNNTTEPDLPKVFPTITKELEIFQKATERRMKLADESIAKLGGASSNPPLHIESPEATREMTPGAQQPGSPSLPKPPLEVPPPPKSEPVAPSIPPLSVPPLDLPPLPASPSPAPLPTPAPLGATPTGNPQADEAALAEIQKELDSLKSAATADATPTAPQT
ncbi:MAG: hypothetical protein V1487_02450 [bacterium]